MIYRLLQRVKHLAFLLRKWLRLTVKQLSISITDWALRTRGGLRGYTFDPHQYAGEFVAEVNHTPSSPAPMPHRLTMIWVGHSPMSPNRIRGEASVRALNPRLQVDLITDDDIDEILVEGHPLHPSYPHLALTHRSDYLRCYIMNFHGGGYCDVKTIARSWEPAFQRISSNPTAWALGYRELSHSSATILHGRIQDDVRRNFFRVIGNGAFIMRPRTPLTSEWFAEVTRRLDMWSGALEKHPGGVRGGEEGGEYPVPKHGILGDVLGPLALKYHERLIIDESIRPDFNDYL